MFDALKELSAWRSDSVQSRFVKEFTDLGTENQGCLPGSEDRGATVGSGVKHI